MKRVTPRRLAVVVVAAVVLIMPLSGCWNPFAPPNGENPDIPVEGFRERTSPENVLHNFILAYERMDDVEYLDCLADTFEFWLYPQDVIDDPTLPWSWDKAEEAAIADAMFGEGTNVDRITLTLTQHGDAVSIPGANPTDPVSWQHEYETDLWVFIPSEDLQLWANAGVRFLFSVDPNETATNGADLWEIAVQHDIVFSGRIPHDGEGGEQISLGQLKARYRD
ncbi:hypothetical protein H8D73_01495 [bacterium]|nr:hypothetical protein [bacterium]